MKVIKEDLFSKASIELLKNKELCKTFAKGQPLEDFYLNRALEEIHNNSKLEKQVSSLKEELCDLREKFKQHSKPLEQRVAELEQDIQQIRNSLRQTKRITDMWEPMK